MVPMASLWLPIVLSGVFVFVASSIMHMVLTYHQSDYSKMPSEGEVMAALRKAGVSPGDYMLPHGGSMKAMKDPAFIEKMTKGPVAFMTVAPSGPPSMGSSLTLWFLFSIVVSIFAAYVAGRALATGAHYLSVFRFVGCVAFMGYAVGLWQNSIWYKRPWSITLKHTLDGLVYALLTAGTFGWLWPR